jgi:sialate O-acetylesterase
MPLLSDHQVLQRDEGGNSTCSISVNQASLSDLDVRITSRDGGVIGAKAKPVQAEEKTHLEVEGLPTGGPYRFTVSDGEADPMAVIDNVWVGDVWVLAGQSNMAGIGELSERLPPLESSGMLSFDLAWKPTLEPIHRFWETKDSAQYKMTPYLGFDISADELDRMYEELQPQNAIEPVGGVGPGAFFAQRLIDLSGVPVGLIPCALSGSSLDMWQKDFHERRGIPFDDSLYGDLVDRVKIAGGRVTGVLWYQGESDALPDESKTYLERFERFVGDLRSDLSDPDLPFITVQLGNVENPDNWTTEDSIERIREAQRLAAERMDRVALVAAADLPRNDHVHISGAGQRVLGERLANAATGFVSGMKKRFSVPRLDRVEATEDGAELTFEGVNGSLRSDQPDVGAAFSVTGSQVMEARISSPRSVRLVTGRPCRKEDEIHYGLGFAPLVPLVDEAGFPVPVFGPVRPSSET